MKILDGIIQGSPEWLALRPQHHGASEAPVMMGASSKMRRNELLHVKATGSDKEICDWVQTHLFDKGHAIEALARPIVEEMIGEELFPATAVDDSGWLMASLDGLTMLGDTIFEHKIWNKSLPQAVRDNDLPPEYYWQLEQQLLVTGAERVIFVVSDGTRDNFEWMEYRPVEGRAEKLAVGWRQFDEDLASYQPAEQKPEAVGRTPENLPALHIEITGEVTASNLAEYRDHAIAVIKAINRTLKTDQDFADAEQTIKWCKGVEDRLAAAKEHALGQTASIDQLFRTIDEISEETRKTRLELNRLVAAEKENLRNRIREQAQTDFAAHIERINKRLDVVKLPTIACDIAGAMKGKRTLATLQDAADTEVARAKIEANEAAERVAENLAVVNTAGKDHMFLFADLQQLVVQDVGTLKALVKARIIEHKAKEAKKLEAELDRIRREEERKAEAAAEAERQRAREEEERRARQAAPEPVVAEDHRPTSPHGGRDMIAREADGRRPQPASPDEPATLTLGNVNALLAPVTLSAGGLAQLGIEPAEVKGSAKMYRESDVTRACEAIIRHISQITVTEAA